MLDVSAERIGQLFTFPEAVEALRAGFVSGAEAPLRHHHELSERPGTADMLLLMPAWTSPRADPPRYAGVKLVTVFPANPARGADTVQGVYVLFSAETGAPLAVLDGRTLTLWRTAAASALAAGFLARADARRLVTVGAGALAPYLIRAHASVRPIEEVAIWNRTPARAQELAASLQGGSFSVRASEDLEAAVRGADIVSCATVSDRPLVHGAWLKAGSHLDLVGAFRPHLRESDDAALARARIFVDTRPGALAEAGDLMQAIASGAIGEADIVADLYQLCRGEHAGRASGDEITLFKSVGTALEDLACAQYLYEKLAESGASA